MDAITILRQQLKQGHDIIEQAVAGLPTEQLHHRAPGSTIQSIAVIYAHTVMSEDYLMNAKVWPRPLLFERSAWADRVGIDMIPFGSGDGDRWVASVSGCNIEALRAYADEVYRETDEYLGTLSEADLDGTINFVDEMSIGSYLGNIVVWHAVHHSGEICALKGVLGGRGLPF
ncbi:MAG TPA: DinB family protein [Nitrolancea sp.]|nr:DinB family protein [Nitrolancea sp.]